MARQKKESADKIRREDITLLIRNNFTMCRNFLDQRLNEALDKKDLPRAKAKSLQTLREYTMCYTKELMEHVDANEILAEEVVLSLAAAQYLVFLTYLDNRSKIELSKHAENMFT